MYNSENQDCVKGMPTSEEREGFSYKIMCGTEAVVRIQGSGLKIDVVPELSHRP